MLTVGSLFAGIGGFDLGLERAGMRTVWFCEQDPFCQRVLARHWPGVPCHPDVRLLMGGSGSDGRCNGSGGDAVSADLPVRVSPVDVLAGGFPCQDISLAGRGAGLAGERSGLWREFARLIGELRPRYVIVENVPALTSRGLSVVLGDLAACGFDAEWDHLPASAFGAPHRRDRIWLVAYPASGGSGASGTNGRAEAGTDARTGRAGDALSDPDGQGSQGHGRPVERAGERAAAARGAANGTRDMADPARHGAEEQAPAGTVGQRARTSGEPAADRRVGGPTRSEDRGGPTDRSLGDPDAERRNGRTGQLGPGRRGEPADAGWWLTEPDVGRVAHGIPNRVDRLRALGNSLVPQIAEWLGRQILEWEKQYE